MAKTEILGDPLFQPHFDHISDTSDLFPLVTIPRSAHMEEQVLLSMLLRFYPKLSWLSRWSLGFIVGMYSAVNITGFGQSDFVTQIHATMTTALRGVGTGEFILNIVAIVGVFSVLIYFFFSKEHKGALGGVAKLGIWFLMVAFGASFGYTVMGRVSLLIGRITFLLRDWLHVID